MLLEVKPGTRGTGSPHSWKRKPVWGGGQVEPSQEAVVPVFLFHNQQPADSQRPPLEGSHSSEHICTVLKRWSRFCWGMSSGICSVKIEFTPPMLTVCSADSVYRTEISPPRPPSPPTNQAIPSGLH